MDSSPSMKRSCFIEEDDGLASIADGVADFSWNHHPVLSRPQCYGRRGSFRNLASLVSSPRSGRCFDARFEDHHLPHFLEACFLCRKPLGCNRDIFMYRGDTPFCSEECRQEQIEIDEAKGKNRNLSSSMRALRKKDQRKSTSPPEAQDYSSRTGTVVAA